jgi:hypothetical protein
LNVIFYLFMINMNGFEFEPNSVNCVSDSQEIWLKSKSVHNWSWTDKKWRSIVIFIFFQFLNMDEWKYYKHKKKSLFQIWKVLELLPYHNFIIRNVTSQSILFFNPVHSLIMVLWTDCVACKNWLVHIEKKY